MYFLNLKIFLLFLKTYANSQVIFTEKKKKREDEITRNGNKTKHTRCEIRAENGK